MEPDRELEARLRRYRPTGPSPELRPRIVGAAEKPRRTWPWAVAAAALLAIALATNSAAARTRVAGREFPPAGAPAPVGDETETVLRQAFGDNVSDLLTIAAADAAMSPGEPQSTEEAPWR